MPTIFVALPVPELLGQQLALLGGGIPGARWEPSEKMHLTLRYLGATEGSQLAAVYDALGKIRFDPFELTLAGAGHFPPRGQPRTVWVGVQDASAVTALHAKVERAVAAAGVDPDRRNFAPHVTLARLRNAPEKKVAEFLAHHSLFAAPAFTVDALTVMSSIRSPGGSKYKVERRYPAAPD